jgi:hypothetical protein
VKPQAGDYFGWVSERMGGGILWQRVRGHGVSLSVEALAMKLHFRPDSGPILSRCEVSMSYETVAGDVAT